MTRRIFGSTLFVTVVMIIISSLLVFGMLYNYFYNEAQDEVRTETDRVAAGVEEQGIDYLHLIEPVVQYRMTLIAADGVVLYDNEATPAEMDNHGDREEVVEALQSGHGSSERFSDTLSTTTIYFAKRLSDGSVMRLSSMTDSIITLLLDLVRPVLVALVTAIILSIAVAWLGAKRIVAPINEIDLERPEEVVLYDELAPLLTRIIKQREQLERRMAEIEYRRSEFETITANMKEGLLVLDSKGHVITHNEGALTLMGIKAPEKLQSVYTLNRSEQFYDCVDNAIEGKHREGVVHFGDRVCRIFANPVLREGDLVGIILLIFDTTESEKHEKIRREFTANVSHELKTPLTSISGFAEIIKNGMVKDSDIKKFAGNIYDEAQRLIALVRDTIKLSELDEKRTDFEKEDINLADTVKSVLKRLEPIKEEKNVSFEIELTPASIFGVEQVIHEMIYNICDNAIRYNREGGRVFVTLVGDDNEVKLSVCDTGAGIPHAERERIFERFYRVDQSRNSVGTGLGLSIVKHGAQLHGASVEVKDREGEGTCFILHFPR